jgi:dTDP-4-amino-4,6-dideoxygalactose transaminase
MSGPGAYLIGEEEKKELEEVIKSGYIVRYGSEDDKNFKRKVATFEKEFSQYMKIKHCIAMNSGTSALLSGLAALGIGPGDEVIVPGYTFIASISAIIYARAIPVLCEIDESLTMDPSDVEKKITKRTKAIMPVHMLGNPCDMNRILKVAKKHNLHVIEDCCQAVGGSYRNKKLGSFGEIGTYSMNWYKIITTGDGGVFVTNDKNLYEKAFGFHDQGHKPLRFGLEIGNRSIIGLNFRINELTGAVALAQLRKLNKIIDTLRYKKSKLKNLIGDMPGVSFRKINDPGECATLLTLIFKNSKDASSFANKIGAKTLIHSGWHVYNNMEQILEKKLPTSFKCPFECKEYGEEMIYEKGMLPKTDDILSRAVNISIGVVDAGIGANFGININSNDEEIEFVAKKIKGYMGEV